MNVYEYINTNFSHNFYYQNNNDTLPKKEVVDEKTKQETLESARLKIQRHNERIEEDEAYNERVLKSKRMMSSNVSTSNH